jgi:hypothetical protein
MNVVGRLIAVLMITLGFVLAAPLLLAQNSPAVDDPNLYRGALQLLCHLHEESLRATKPEDATVIRAHVIQQFGINEADYWKLVKEGASLLSTMSSNALSNRSATDSLNATISRLPGELTPGGWHSFREYVNGDYRAHTHLLTVSSHIAIK